MTATTFNPTISCSSTSSSGVPDQFNAHRLHSSNSLSNEALEKFDNEQQNLHQLDEDCHHEQRDHLLILDEDGEFSYVLIPTSLVEADSPKLCFLDHRTSSAGQSRKSIGDIIDDKIHQCCLQNGGHVHGHVHHGNSIQDILLEQCSEAAGCTLPSTMPPSPNITNACTISDELLISNKEVEYDGHVHKEGCGHEQIAHGDHLDWLVPASDGSFLLSHAYVDGDSGKLQFIRHGHLVKVGETRGRLRKHTKPQLQLHLFSFATERDLLQDSPTAAAAATKLHSAGVVLAVGATAGGSSTDSTLDPDIVIINMSQPSIAATYKDPISMPDAGKPLLQQELAAEERVTRVQIDDDHNHKRCCTSISAAAGTRPRISNTNTPLESQIIKTTINVLGICCPSEVPLVKRILEPAPGVQQVLVNVTAKTVTVRHDPALASPECLVKLLNESRLEASIHHKGEWNTTHKWPSPYTIACGILVAITFFQYIFSPLRWVSLGAVAVGIPPIVMRSFVSLRRCILDINILMLIAVAGAIALGDYLEAGSIVFLFTLADWLESRSSDKARLAISSVASLGPQRAILAESGMEVPVADVKVGTKLSVKAGEQVPIDGVVISGKSTVDESSLTGESVPVEKQPGDTVWSGTLNMTGYICIETTALVEDSTASKMARLIEEAQAQRSHLDQLVEKFAKYYTPLIVITAVAIATVPLYIHPHNTKHWLYLALVLLVVACPCALVLSTPITTTCAIAKAAKMGFLVKSGSSLEALGKLKVMAVDKTGTLTKGQFQVVEVLPINKNTDLHRLLYWMSCIESKSSHPMASALVSYAKLQYGIEPSGHVEDFTIIDGEGVSGVLDGYKIHIGNERLANRFKWANHDMEETIESWKSQGWTICWIGVNEKLEGILSAGDQLRTEALEAVHNMKRLGLHIVMLTGDSLTVANAVNMKLGTNSVEVHAQLLPEEKVSVLRQLKKKGLTGMVGDGINDAPALAAADVGIAMGAAGSAMAMETADVALMTNNLKNLAHAVELACKARKKIQQNIFLSITVKLLVIVLAAAGYASLWGAVVADVGTCLLVIFNSMLLLGRQTRANSSCSTGQHNHDHHRSGHKHCHGHLHQRHDHSHQHKLLPSCSVGHSKKKICANFMLCCNSDKDEFEDLECCTSKEPAAQEEDLKCLHHDHHHHIAGWKHCSASNSGCTNINFCKDSNSCSKKVRRRVGHKDTCTKDCAEDHLNSLSTDLRDPCLEPATTVLFHLSPLSSISSSCSSDGGKETRVCTYQAVNLCNNYCGVETKIVSPVEDYLCSAYCCSEKPISLFLDTGHL